jgi:hypothetical protein
MTTRQHHGASRVGRGGFPGGDWIRRNTLTAGIIAGALTLITTAVIVVVMSAGSSAAHPATAPAKTPVTAGTRWLDASANANLNPVNAAVIALTNAATRRRFGAATAAGTQLATAATTALHGAMPPVDAQVYRAALAVLVRAGHDAAAGKLASAMPLVNDGIAGLITVTASANAPKPR